MSLYKNITGQSFPFVLFHYTFFLIIYTDVYIYIYMYKYHNLNSLNYFNDDFLGRTYFI